jgi:hypothetical protein
MPAEVAPNTEIPEKPAAVAAPEGAAPTTPDKPAVPGEAISKEGVAAPKTALEAAQRVMAKGANAAPEAKPQDGTQPPPAPAPKAGEVDEDDSALPFKDHPSWKAMREKARGLSSQNRILTVAKEKNEVAIRDLEPKAKAHDGLLGYFSENNLGQEDVSAGLQIMAAIRNDPRRAYDMLRPVMDRLEATVGAKLPADLQGKVDSGLLDPAIAAELAKARAGEGLEKQRRAEAEARAARDREAREVEERKRSEDEVLDVVVSALNDAEAEWAKGRTGRGKIEAVPERCRSGNGWGEAAAKRRRGEATLPRCRRRRQTARGLIHASSEGQGWQSASGRRVRKPRDRAENRARSRQDGARRDEALGRDPP